MGDVATIPLFWTNPTYNYELLAIIILDPTIFLFQDFYGLLEGLSQIDLIAHPKLPSMA